jgi:Histidine kinase-, DNA gyrase B-, and HSP90-like ATPase
MPQIRVHEKALAHLSRGLYRSPASALRELVSNAWDANATHVLITTNYPSFSQISVQDNGNGFSREEFEKLMEGGIGNSEKRNTPESQINGRPLIGRLGIGLLGIAQICGSFSVTSKPTNGAAFRARVRLYDLIREKLDSDDPSIVKDDLAGGIREVDVGEYEFLDPDEDVFTRGTRITSDDVHPTFVRSFRESLKAPKFKEPPLDWSKCLTIVSRVHSLHELGDYWKLLWELSAACPIPYVSADAVPQGAVREIQKRLVTYDFTLKVDGITLAKPVRLRGNRAGYTVAKIQPTTQNVYGKRLEFEGYIAVQEGLQLKPDELRGIMIRIKNIGVGYYDPSFLDYPWNQGPREKWVTGEVFVNAGLEDALNVDRDSFNRFHPEFRAVQQRVHEILRTELFPKVYKQIDVRSKDKAEGRAEARTSHLQDVVAASLETRVKVRSSPGKDKARKPVDVETTQDELKITFGDLSQLRTKKAQRQLAATVLALYDIASRERSVGKQRQRFEELLLALLSRW